MHYRQAFKSVIRGMLNVGFEEEEVVSVVALLAGIILTGDIVRIKINVIMQYLKHTSICVF